MTTRRIPRLFGCAFIVAITLGVGVTTASARTTIRSPGAHPKYTMELEPHVLLHWSQAAWGNDGVGLGARASIPVLENGFVPRVNNSVAVTFGLNWAHFGDTCRYWLNFYDPNWGAAYGGYDCSVNTFWVPVAMQWNFWFTDVISLFAEPGLALSYTSYDYVQRCASPSGWCQLSNTDTDLNGVLWLGARFMFSKDIGAVVRLGSPNLSVGLNFLL